MLHHPSPPTPSPPLIYVKGWAYQLWNHEISNSFFLKKIAFKQLAGFVKWRFKYLLSLLINILKWGVIIKVIKFTKFFGLVWNKDWPLRNSKCHCSKIGIITIDGKNVVFHLRVTIYLQNHTYRNIQGFKNHAQQF